MPERKTSKEKNKAIKSQNPETDNKDSWDEDQKKRGYYYDDACGYEVYQPDEEDEDLEQTNR